MLFPFVPVVLGMAIIGALTGWRAAKVTLQAHWLLRVAAGVVLVMVWVAGGAKFLNHLLPHPDPKNIWHAAFIFGWVAGMMMAGVFFMAVSILSRHRRVIAS